MKHLTLLFLFLISYCSYGQGSSSPDYFEENKGYTFTNQMEIRRDSIFDMELKVKREGKYVDYTLTMYYKGKLMETHSNRAISLTNTSLTSDFDDPKRVIASYRLADEKRIKEGYFCEIDVYAMKDDKGRRLISIYYGNFDKAEETYLALYQQENVIK